MEVVCSGFLLGPAAPLIFIFLLLLISVEADNQLT